MSRIYVFILLSFMVAATVSHAELKPISAAKEAHPTLDVQAGLAIKAQIAAAIAGGENPAALLAELNALYASTSRPGGGRLDQGGETAESATTIASLPYMDAGSTTGTEDDYAARCASDGGRDVVYRYTPPSNGYISVTTCGSSFDTEIEVFDHAPNPYSMPLACNDDWCGLASGVEAVWVEADHTYFIVIDGYSQNAVGDYVLHVVEGHIGVRLGNCGDPLPGGETIATAPSIGLLAYCGNTCGMSDDYNSTCGSSGGVDAVYRYTSSFTGTLTVATCGSEFDTELYIMDAAANYLACNDDWCWTTNGNYYSSAILDFPVVQGETYYIGVDGYAASSCGVYYLRLTRTAMACETVNEPFATCRPSGNAIASYDSVVVPIYVPFSYGVADVNVGVNLTHTYCADLIIRLESPAGTRVVLSNRRGGGGDNFHCTVFDDEASTPIGAGSPPFEGSYIPDAPLSAFDAESALGYWKVIVHDTAAGDIGRVLGACVVVTPMSLAADDGAVAVTEYALHQNYPNPFNPQTSISFDLAAAGPVKLEVFNTLGQSVAVLYDGVLGAGPHAAIFNAAGLPSGLYVYRLQAGNFVDLKKMIMMK